MIMKTGLKQKYRNATNPLCERMFDAATCLYSSHEGYCQEALMYNCSFITYYKSESSR
jgi:hypothetical protein